MKLIDILLHRGYISSAITTLGLWNSKKPNARAREMAKHLQESFDGFDWLESQLKEKTRINKEYEIVIRNLQNELEKKQKEIDNLKDGL